MPKVDRDRQQHTDRAQIELEDNHGRVWVSESEVGLNANRRPQVSPVGSFIPTFRTPYDFLPANKYLIYDSRRPSSLTIAYRTWIIDQQNAHREVSEYLARLAWSIYKDQAPKYIKNPSPEMLDIVYGRGKGPEPVEPIVAAMQGNGWILGLRPYDKNKSGDARLLPYLELWQGVRYRDVSIGDEIFSRPELNFADDQDAYPSDDFVITDRELDTFAQRQPLTIETEGDKENAVA